MTEEQKIDAVTARLTGAFVVGDRVRVNCVNSHFHKRTGVIVELDALGNEHGARLKLDTTAEDQGGVLRPWYRFADLEPA